MTHGRKYTADELWANYEYFIKAVAPVNPQAGSAFSIGYMKGLIERVIAEG